MDQYCPAWRVNSEHFPEINRTITSEEYEAALDDARRAGLWRFDTRHLSQLTPRFQISRRGERLSRFVSKSLRDRKIISWSLRNRPLRQAEPCISGKLMRFIPPTREQRMAAVGSTSKLPELLRLALEPHDDFEPVPHPGPDDWLATHPERGQTVEHFLRSQPNRPDSQHQNLYLQPVYSVDEGEAPALDRLQRLFLPSS
jgi:hypothetical protein